MSALDEYRAVLAKIDSTVAQLSERAGDALVCAKGCSQCCAAGLTVTAVEAAFIEAFLEGRTITPSTSGGCAFLDDQGACQIYEARPLVCRTQGLALKIDDDDSEIRRLPILNDSVTACALNYTERLPSGDEILDMAPVSKLLFVVDQRFSGEERASEKRNSDERFSGEERASEKRNSDERFLGEERASGRRALDALAQRAARS